MAQLEARHPKSVLLEMFQERGWDLRWPELVAFEPSVGGWRAVVDYQLRDGRRLSGEGKGSRKGVAEEQAFRQALEGLPPLPSDPDLELDAERGDLLIKLAVRWELASGTGEERSRWLQEHETDARLAALFDAWKLDGDEELRMLGDERGQKYKATVVEALIWRRFGERVLAASAEQALAEIVALVGD